ncbi:MAG: hypothetical protein K2J31_06735 [Alistipes sp.]|nr:hypothetical protein [Alistipes sp.]
MTRNRVRTWLTAVLLALAAMTQVQPACGQHYLPARKVAATADAAKPAPDRIARDLVGHTLSEGVDNGYHNSDWRWTIEQGEISDLRIERVLQNDNGTYRIVVSMKLSAAYYAYDTRAEVAYTLSPRGEWQFDYVVSLGMRIIATHQYDNCIRTSIVEDGWGGTYCLSLRNISEITLAVGGSILANGTWLRFSQLVRPQSEQTVGGLFMGGSVESYKIEFIVREQ